MSNRDLSKWYEGILFSSGIASPGLAKGTLFIHPRGWYIWERIQDFVNSEFRRHGIRNVGLPSLIPLDEIAREKENLNGFAPELFLVSRGNSGGPDLFLRPTSEILFCHLFRRILDRGIQPPLLYNQWCSVFRAEKNTRAFLRGSEFWWQEAHTIHRTREEALSYLRIFHETYIKLVRDLLCLDFLQGEKTSNERFVGSEMTLALEAVMPDGQSLQIATSHYLSTNFSSMFGVEYTSDKNLRVNPHQLSAGSSTRLLGALILSHSDESGLILPFGLADVQVMIIVLDNAIAEGSGKHRDIENQLGNYLVSWDFSGRSFGKKIRDFESSGTPFALIIGTREVSAGVVTFRSRLSREGRPVAWSEIFELLSRESVAHDEVLRARSRDKLTGMVVRANTLEDVKREVLENGRIVLAPWFDDPGNEESFSLGKFGFSPRCIKERLNNSTDRCFYSNKIANTLTYFGRSY